MSYGVILFDTFIPAIIVVPVIGVCVFGLFVLAIVLDDKAENKEGGK